VREEERGEEKQVRNPDLIWYEYVPTARASLLSL
jgi:hypothetical protein